MRVLGPCTFFFCQAHSLCKLRQECGNNVPVGCVHGGVTDGARAALRMPSAEAVCWELVEAAEGEERRTCCQQV